MITCFNQMGFSCFSVISLNRPFQFPQYRKYCMSIFTMESHCLRLFLLSYNKLDHSLVRITCIVAATHHTAVYSFWMLVQTTFMLFKHLLSTGTKQCGCVQTYVRVSENYITCFHNIQIRTGVVCFF